LTAEINPIRESYLIVYIKYLQDNDIKFLLVGENIAYYQIVDITTVYICIASYNYNICRNFELNIRVANSEEFQGSETTTRYTDILNIV
jgi:hypothetical protein